MNAFATFNRRAAETLLLFFLAMLFFLAPFPFFCGFSPSDCDSCAEKELLSELLSEP